MVSCKREYHDMLNIEIAACSFSLCTMTLNLGWPHFLPNSLKVFTIQLIYKLQQPLLMELLDSLSDLKQLVFVD